MVLIFIGGLASWASGVPKSIIQIVSAVPPPLYFIHATFVEGVQAIAAVGQSGFMMALAAIACDRRLFNLVEMLWLDGVS